MLATRVGRQAALLSAAARLLPAAQRAVASWAGVDPKALSGSNPATVSNLGGRAGRCPTAALHLVVRSFLAGLLRAASRLQCS